MTEIQMPDKILSGNSSGISKKGNIINPCVTIKCQAFYVRVNNYFQKRKSIDFFF
jgi:hypothetical protein